MSTVTRPSKTVPGFPEVVMDCPQGWVPRSVPEAQIAILQAIRDGVELVAR